ncbi:MAG: DUF6992 family protein [Salinivenus sp.]
MRSFVVFALLLLLTSGLLAGPDLAFAQSSDAVQELSADLHSAQRAHLWRVAAWGGANVLGGLALVGGSSRTGPSAARWNFGAMSAGWGAVNVGIAAVGLATTPDAPLTDPSAALGAERQFHDILLFNLGLNVAYSAVGGTMVAAGYRDVGNAARWRGFGTALILQGVGLFALDAIAFLASRTRLSSLLDTTGALSFHTAPTGAVLSLSL